MIFNKIFGIGDVLTEKLETEELDALKGGLNPPAAACRKGGGCTSGGGCSSGGDDSGVPILNAKIDISAW